MKLTITVEGRSPRAAARMILHAGLAALRPFQRPLVDSLLSPQTDAAFVGDLIAPPRHFNARCRTKWVRYSEAP